MFRARAHGNGSTHKACETGNAHQQAQLPGGGERSRVLEDPGEATMGQQLDRLGDAHGKLAAFLNRAQVIFVQLAGAQRVPEQIGGGDRILNGEIDSDPAGRHGRHHRYREGRGGANAAND